MAEPTATEIRNELEGYGITDSVLSDGWIERCRDEEIIPHIQHITRMTFTSETSVTEYYNGTGTETLILNRRPVVAITNLQYVGSIDGGNLQEAVELVGSEGILRAKTNYAETSFRDGYPRTIFWRGNKNIKVTYTYGYADYPTEVFRAIKNLVAAKMLCEVGNRTGGGDLSVQAFSRSYGEHGKYTYKMKCLANAGYSLLRPLMTGVTGG